MRTGLLLRVLAMSWTAGVGAAELRLVGTVSLSEGGPGDSHAVFETGTGEQQTVRIGQQVGGCRLAAVRQRSAVMECAGGSMSLVLQSGLGPTREPVETAPARYRITLPRADFAVVLEDRQRVSSEVALEPAVRDGWLYGYRVAWLEPGGQFHRLGLQADDVVVSFNGVPASTPGAFMQALGVLPELGGFQLTVERSGGLIEYSYLFE